MSRAHILVADDLMENRLILEAFLGDSYTVHAVGDGQQVMDYLAGGQPVDLILLDVMMPVLDGYETCRRIKALPAGCDIPVLFLTSLDRSADEEKGLLLGAEDFIRKPFSPPAVLARVKNHLALAQARRGLRDYNRDLERAVQQRTQEIQQQTEELVRQKRKLIAAQAAIISAFCALAEARDNETGNHIRRTQNYVQVSAQHLHGQAKYAEQLNDGVIDLLQRSAPLHDIGKVGIPDHILLKPGRLEPEEWRIMKSHCQLGFNAVQEAAGALGEAQDFLHHARDIALCHHERFDGAGYPQGLAGEAIPLSARLMAVADVYDALISQRCYKPAYPHEQAVEMMRAERGGHFDPEVLDAFLAEEAVFREIATRYADTTAPGDTR